MGIRAGTIRRAAGAAVLAAAAGGAAGMGVAAGAAGAAGATGAMAASTATSTWQATSRTSIRPSVDQPVGSMQLTIDGTAALKPTSHESFVIALSNGTFVSGKVSLATAPSSDAATVSPTITPQPGSRTATFSLMSTSTGVELKKTEKINLTTVVIDATPQTSLDTAGIPAGTAIKVTVVAVQTTPVVAPANSVEVATVASNGAVRAASVTEVTSSGADQKAGNLTVSLINDTGTTLATTVLALTVSAGTVPSTRTTQQWSKAPALSATTATARVTSVAGRTLTLRVSEAAGTTGTISLTTVRYTTVAAAGTLRVGASWKLASGVQVGVVTSAVNAVAPTAGYWLVAADGGIFSFGSAGFHGSMGGQHLNAPIVGMAEDRATGGYWEVASDGGIFSFDAPFYGSTGGTHLNAPIVGMAATPTGGGYWLVASDGGIFTFGDAPFYGSMGGTHLDAPVSGMVATADGKGYSLVARTGGVFTFGDAAFSGSCTGSSTSETRWVGIAVNAGTTPASYLLAGADGGIATVSSYRIHCMITPQTFPRSATVVGIAVGPGGLWLVAATGGVDAVDGSPFYGSMAGTRLSAPVVGMAVAYG